MSQPDFRDLLGAAGLILAGAVLGLVAWFHYPMGTIARMGPGFFPVVLAVILSALGVMLLLATLVRVRQGMAAAPGAQGEGRGASGPGAADAVPAPAAPPVEWSAMLSVLAAILVFAATSRTLGQIPAIVLTVVVVTIADPTISWRARAGIAITLSLMAYVVFRWMLGLQFIAFRWPL